MEDLRAIRSGICTDREEEKCRNEFGDNLEWACDNCKKKRAEDLGPYTCKLLRLRNLRDAGYAFNPNDLTPEEWEDFGEVEQWLRTVGP